MSCSLTAVYTTIGTTCVLIAILTVDKMGRRTMFREYRVTDLPHRRWTNHSVEQLSDFLLLLSAFCSKASCKPNIWGLTTRRDLQLALLLYISISSVSNLSMALHLSGFRKSSRPRFVQRVTALVSSATSSVLSPILPRLRWPSKICKSSALR